MTDAGDANAFSIAPCKLENEAAVFNGLWFKDSERFACISICPVSKCDALRVGLGRNGGEQSTKRRRWQVGDDRHLGNE